MKATPIPRQTILSWAEEDRPREKLVLKGKAALSEAELIGILIGSGTTSMTAVDVAKHILKEVDYNLHELARLSVKDLQKFKGIGEAKAITIVSALELGRRRKESEQEQKPVIKSSKDAYVLLQPHLMDLPHEEFWVLLMNRANKLIKKQPMSSGGMSGTVVDPRIIFRLALEHQATSFICAHNHPSGNKKPSESDIRLTKKLAEGGKLLEINLLDHLIFTNEGYSSFADEGWM